MNWFSLTLCSMIGVGGVIAVVYETLAYQMGFPVGRYFQRGGPLTLIGGFATFGAMILSAFINPWWSIFIVLICSWLFSQIIIRVFGTVSQIISLLFLIGGTITIFFSLV